MQNLNLQIDYSQVENLTQAMPREIFNATRSAIRTTTTFAEKLLEQKMADATKLPKNVFKVHRVLSRFSDSQSNPHGRVYFYILPVKARFAGKMTNAPEEGGARAGEYAFKGGFIAKMRKSSGLESIFTRIGKSRLPIKEEVIKLPQTDVIVKEVADIAEGEVTKRFSEKLNGYLNGRTA